MKQCSEAPVEKNERLTLTIDGISHEGVGIGHVAGGYAIFVPNAYLGEEVEVLIVKVKPQMAFGKLLSISKPSPARVEPLCPIYHRCGGCSLQHLNYEEQLRLKRDLVKQQLVRLGGFHEEDLVIYPTLGMDAHPTGVDVHNSNSNINSKDDERGWYYRNKAQVPVGLQEGKWVSGFFAPRSHEIIPMDRCLIQHETNDELIQKVKTVAEQLGILPYDEERHQGFLRHIMTRVGIHSGELMLVLVTNGRKFPQQAAFVEQIRQAMPALTSIYQNINTQRTNVILGKESILLWGNEVIVDELSGIRFAISPRSFYQVNPLQTEKLYETARKYAGLTGEETVVDAYCGIGTISLYMAQQAKKVIGVEVVPEAIEDAKKNAELNGISNVEFHVGEAETWLPQWVEDGNHADVVVVDPPRKGCDEALLEALATMQPPRIVYVSCNPSTLARDARYLVEHGYKLEKVQPVDMFPQTYHVENVVLMSRVEK
ncbi:23S rRNA (uracil(1939)-C(5))-methyltransferase RlmD [Rubeoparvulum massiliense]|uniref:23S rRNA (uracil(1939)-C(5))-methyltransferase RlmD n=1 Tax=Rubeoparvulum massiliense TaxID=1631346 RepID=UPI00065E90C5|nr:23S rRNA (uracil(1939)-C(5))-methyltransferase RlmD [Rubeoparvulum massiliense]